MKVSELKADMDAAFEQVGERFQEVDKRFAQVDKRFEQVDERFEQVDKRLEHIDERLEHIDARFDRLERRIDEHETTIRRHFDVIAEDLKSQIRASVDASAQNQRHLASMSSENVTLLSALSDHELRLRVLEGKRH